MARGGAAVSAVFAFLPKLFLVAMHLFLIANIVTTSKAPVTRSVARVSYALLLP